MNRLNRMNSPFLCGFQILFYPDESQDFGRIHVQQLCEKEVFLAPFHCEFYWEV